MNTEPEPSPSAQQLRAAFDAAEPLTVGIEDEVMLLDPFSFELLPRAQELLSGLTGDERFKLELPASQLEIVTAPCESVLDAAATLLDSRRALAAALDGRARLASAGVHPTTPGLGELNQLERYEHTLTEYASVARRQLVCALQVHVAVGGAERALAVYNAARSYLPLLAALAANAPFYEGRDSGLASVRPKLGELLPRQGVPPALPSWDAYAEALRWGAAAGTFPDARTWWWELRLHRRYGTLEFRVPDGQSTVADAAAVAAIAQSLVAWLSARHDANEPLAVHERWRIEENRWSACRHGVQGKMADLETGARRPTREALSELLGAISPHAPAGCADGLARARELVEVNGAMEQRAVVAREGLGGLVPWLAGRFSASQAG